MIPLTIVLASVAGRLLENTVNPTRIPPIPTNVTGTLANDFFFGFASAAAQVEGAIDVDGKSPSIWDVFSKRKGKVADGTTTNTTIDEYYNYQETIDLLKMSGANSYRLSIAWSRLIPGGVKGSPVNQKAVQHYRKVFKALLDNGITPFVTLYHWDMPQVLEDTYKSLLNTERWNEDFVYFADAAFKHFGDQVKHWVTYNEPGTICLGSYLAGYHPPNRCLDIRKCKFSIGPLDMLHCAHSILTSHARAVDLYRRKYKRTQKGVIGIVNIIEWAEPITNDPEDVKATELRLDFSFGWYVDPLFTGDYPPSMRKAFRFILPQFTNEEKRLLIGSSDFFGLNHYTTSYVARPSFKRKDPKDGLGSTLVTPFVSTHYDINGNLMGEKGATFWLFSVPWGFKKALKYIHTKYNVTDIYITENGFSITDEYKLPLRDKLKDKSRITYYQEYLNVMQEVIKETNIKIKAYFAWTLIDNFEWHEGFTTPFGSTIFDKQANKRFAKDSFFYLKDYFAQAMKKQ
jgi:beta-glucosidase